MIRRCTTRFRKRCQISVHTVTKSATVPSSCINICRRDTKRIYTRFEQLRDAFNGTSECSHCHAILASWSGLKHRIEHANCPSFGTHRPPQVITADRADLRAYASTQAWQALTEKQGRRCVTSGTAASYAIGSSTTGRTSYITLQDALRNVGSVQNSCLHSPYLPQRPPAMQCVWKGTQCST